MAFENGIHKPFIWYRLSPYGMAEAIEETPEIVARINKGEPGWYGNIEGMILDGMIQATAFSVKTEEVFDSVIWLETKERVSRGTRTTIKITASPEKNLTEKIIRTIYNP